MIVQPIIYYMHDVVVSIHYNIHVYMYYKFLTAILHFHCIPTGLPQWMSVGICSETFNKHGLVQGTLLYNNRKIYTHRRTIYSRQYVVSVEYIVHVCIHSLPTIDLAVDGLTTYLDRRFIIVVSASFKTQKA